MGFVGVQGVHVVELGIEGEVVEKVVVEETVLRSRLKGIGGTFQGVICAGWPRAHLFRGSLSAASPPLQICCCLHGEIQCFFSGEGCFIFGLLFGWGLGFWEYWMLDNVGRYRRRH